MKARTRQRVRRGLTVGVVTAALAGALVLVMAWERGPVTVQVWVPDLSAEALGGKQAFDRRCAQCHGADARGSPIGPPLVHSTYQPRHHADVSFTLAVRRGVQAHHWGFGSMPPQREVTAAEVEQITRYVRELQRANGIH
jgi:mono/diheme cytochrome c family protein